MILTSLVYYRTPLMMTVMMMKLVSVVYPLFLKVLSSSQTDTSKEVSMSDEKFINFFSQISHVSRMKIPDLD